MVKTLNQLFGQQKPDAGLNAIKKLETSDNFTFGGLTDLYTGNKSPGQQKLDDTARKEQGFQSCVQMLESLEQMDSFSMGGITDLMKGNINTQQFKQLGAEKSRQSFEATIGYLSSLGEMNPNNLSGLDQKMSDACVNTHKLNMVA
jgi:hypothetical protein